MLAVFPRMSHVTGRTLVWIGLTSSYSKECYKIYVFQRGRWTWRDLPSEIFALCCFDPCILRTVSPAHWNNESSHLYYKTCEALAQFELWATFLTLFPLYKLFSRILWTRPFGLMEKPMWRYTTNSTCGISHSTKTMTLNERSRHRRYQAHYLYPPLPSYQVKSRNRYGKGRIPWISVARESR